MKESRRQDAPTVSVIVVNWNGEDLLRDCIDSLLAQGGVEGPLEVVVVDNGSTDGSLALLATHYPTVLVAELPQNLGFAGGVNAGIRAAHGQVIVLMNNDATADADFVSQVVSALERNPHAGAVTARILLAHRYSRVAPGTPAALRGADGAAWARDDAQGELLVNSTGNEVTRSGNGRDRDWLTPVSADHRPSGTVMGFSGGAVALRRSAVEAVGGFDERLFMYYEDSDLAWRLRRAGWDIVYERAAVVHHQHAASSGASSDFFLFHNERNRLLVALKNAPASVIARALVHTIGSTIVAVLRGRFTVAGRKLRSLGAALRLCPQFLADRRSIDRGADVSRQAIANMLVAD